MLRNVHSHDRMAGLVVRGELALVFGHDHGPPLRSEHNLVLRLFEVFHRNVASIDASGPERSLVDEIRQIRARKTRRASRDDAEIDVRSQRTFFRVDSQYLPPTADVGVGHEDLPVESARTAKSGVKHVGPVGRGDDDNSVVLLEPVHFNQKLIERLLALVIAAADADSARPADCIDLVDEHDARSVLFGLLEHVPHAGGADADEHLHEIRSGY